MTSRSSRFVSFLLLITVVVLQAGCASPVEPNLGDENDAVSSQQRRAQQYEQSGATYKALSVYQAILADYPDNVSVLTAAAELSERIGEAQVAAIFYTKLVLVEPDNVEWQERLAMIQIQQGQLTAAKKTLVSLADKAPTRWRIWSGLGLLADIDGNYQEALELHRKATQLGKDQPTAYNNLGYSLLMAQHYGEAEQALRSGLHLNPQDERLYNNLLIAMAWQGHYEDAIQEGRLIFKEWIVYNNVGYIALQRGEYQAAIKMLKSALSLSPSYYPTAAENLRKAQSAQGKR